MTLRELEATVLQLRDEITLATQSSTGQASLAEELLVFERALGRRQAGRIALVFATAASRRQVRTSIATPGGGISAIELDLTARSLFWQGVYTGLVDEIPPGKVRDFLTDVQENWPVLNLGYNVGVVQGLGHGVVNLVNGLALLARLAFWASPGGTALELARMIQNPQAYYAARQAEYEQLKKTIAAVHRFLVDFKADPTIVLQLSAELGVAIGEGLGAKIRAFLDEPAYEKGRDIGDVVGQVLFEVLLQILLAAATAGIGNAIRAGAAGGEVAARSGRLALAIHRVLEASPAVRRLVMEFAGHAELVGTGRKLEQEAAAARELAGAIKPVSTARTTGATAEVGVVEQAAVKGEELGPGERAVEKGLPTAETPRPTEPARPVPEKPEPARPVSEEPEPGRAPEEEPLQQPKKEKSTKSGSSSGQQVTKQFSADKVPYQVTGSASDFAAIKGTSVYVLKDAEGNVLYVGEGNAFDRLRAHINDPDKTPWFGEIARIEIRGSEFTKKEALAFEEDLIEQLEPMYNKELKPFETAFPGQLRGQDLPKGQPVRKFDVRLGESGK
jgi:hypothetical protein